MFITYLNEADALAHLLQNLRGRAPKKTSAGRRFVAYYSIDKDLRIERVQPRTPRPAARTTEVDVETAGQRLDNFLLARLKGVPRTLVYRLIRSGQVRVNSGRSRPSYRIRAGDRVRIPPVVAKPAASTATPGGLDWLEERILYEDERLLVLDKPAGLAVHGGSGVALGCIEALRALRPSVDLELVHRLDRATSGCLLIAKRRSALRSLHSLLREGNVEKQYLGLARGAWVGAERAVDVALTKFHRGPMHAVKADEAGKPSVTRFRPVERYGRLAALLEIRILTGRTHQIRVHAAHIGHPLAGDERYGDPGFNAVMAELGLKRLFLHAQALAFTWPDSHEEFAVHAPLPADLGACIDRLETLGTRERQRLESRLA